MQICVFQIHYLRLTTAILHHEKSRKYLLNNVLYPSVSFSSSYTIWDTSSHVFLNEITFDVMRSVVFFYIKTPLRVKEAGLEELILTTWWPTHFDKEVRGAYHGHFQSRYPSFTLQCCRNRTWPEQFLLWRMVVSIQQGKDEREAANETTDERLRRRAYERGCQRLKKRIEG